MRQSLRPNLVMRARGDNPMDGQVAAVMEDVQVVAKPKRRTYSAEYKRRILKEVDACATPGAVGALLRREGLYSSHLVMWRGASWRHWHRRNEGASPRGPMPVIDGSPSSSASWRR